MDKRLTKGQTTRHHILEVAARLFTDHGYDATSIETILVECAISRGALYHHFANKEQLFEAVFETVEQEVTAKLMAGLIGDTDAEKQFRAGCRAFLSEAQAPSFRRIALIDAPLVLGWEKWREIESRHGLGLIKAGLLAAIRSSGHTIEAINETAHLLLAALIEASLLIARAPDKEAATRACSGAIDRLLDGIIK